jgi:uncharacterized membrane protein YcaP (DUF421 family)
MRGAIRGTLRIRTATLEGSPRMDIAALFSFHVSPLEIAVRGSLMYWFLFLVFRFVLRRDAGSVGIADLLLVVLIADASQNAMAGGYDSVAEGCLLAATLVGWNYAIDWAAYRWEAVRRLVEPAPLLLVDRGRVLARNMRQEFLTRDELDAHLRQNGIASIDEVRAAYMEGDGKFSVVTYDKPRPRA